MHAGRGLGSLAIIVVNYGSHELLSRHLVEVSRQAPDACVVVVDNHTTMAEREAVQALCRRQDWRCLALDENAGFGAAINRAVASGLDPKIRHLLLLNPDAVLTRDALERLLSQVEEHPFALVAPTVLSPDGRTWSAGVDLYLANGEMRSWRNRTAGIDPSQIQPWVSGACLMLSRELWDRTGGFDDDYFLYWEDVDFSRRVLDVGGRIVVDPEAFATHDEGGTHRGDNAARAKSSIYYYYNVRNRLLFAAKHLPTQDQRHWRRCAPLVAYRILLQGGRRQFRHPQRNLLPAFRGTVDGLRLMRKHRSRPG